MLRNRSPEQCIRPRRNRGEGGASYCTRLADANGFPGARSFCRDIGITLGGLASGRMLSTIAAVGHCDIDALVHDSPSKRADGTRLAGEFLGHGLYVRSRGRRFCPECFRADLDRPAVQLSMPREWNRVWWDVAGVTACHQHQALLQWRCICNRVFDHQVAGIGRCECGFALAQLPPVKVRSAAAASYIVGRLGYSARISVPVLDDLSLGDAIRGIRIFGASLVAAAADEHVVMEAGYRVLAGADEEIRTALETVSSRRPERPGSLGAYGELHAFARDTADGRGSDRLLRAMRSHARAHCARATDRQ
ncbi:MAG TPA: hypothetical protein ENH55_23245 [Aurantimonas coralicida]|uniref:TniQ domain-containing protein n=1 Tax=Aurantimonas coralicida TaxID=182270 RepID=A0A9C9TI93_9HYPH|nr:hypothetical protein [Aurantimonas coralicida]HEU02295.1 hypothetical protein [Aurantimonas coralicida]